MTITVIVIALALCAVMLFYMAVRSRRKKRGKVSTQWTSALSVR